MAGVDFSVLRGISGILKIVTLVLGFITLILTAHSYYHYGKDVSDNSNIAIHIKSDVPKETTYLSFVIIVLLLSAILIILRIIGILTDSEIIKKIDAGYHVVAGLLLLITAIVWFTSVHDQHKPYEAIRDLNLLQSRGLSVNEQYAERIIAGIFGLANAVVYFAVAFFVLKPKE